MRPLEDSAEREVNDNEAHITSRHVQHSNNSGAAPASSSASSIGCASDDDGHDLLNPLQLQSACSEDFDDQSVATVRYSVQKCLPDHKMVLSAAQDGLPDLLRLLLQAGADVNWADSSGRNALMFSAQKDGRSCNCSTYIDQRPGQGSCARQDHPCEINVGRRDCLKLLLEMEVDTEAVDSEGYTPLMYALRSYNHLSAQLLLDHGAHVNVVAKNGKTPLDQALDLNRRDYEVTHRLLDLGADLELSKESQDHLMIMIAEHRNDIVRKMIKNGCSPHCPEGVSKTRFQSPLATALVTGNVSAARYFVTIGYINEFDLFRLAHDAGIQHSLRSQLRWRPFFGDDYSQLVSLLSLFSESPQSLFTISIVAVSRAVDQCARQAKSLQSSKRYPRSLNGENSSKMLGMHNLTAASCCQYSLSNTEVEDVASDRRHPRSLRRDIIGRLPLPLSLQRALFLQTDSPV